MLTRRTMVTGAGAALYAGPALAQSDRTIRIIAGFPAGGGIDVSARLLVDPIKDAFGAPTIVENRTGAAGMIAASTVAKAAPDGRTLLMATSGEIAISHHLYKEKMTYDPLKELAPVALVGIVPCVVVVAEATPVRTPQELIAYAKANPGKLSFSSSGVGNPQQLAGELMNIMAGTNVLHVPYRGSAPAVTDVATGAVTMSFSSLATVQGLMQSGKIRAVAVTSLDRMPQLPDVAPLQDGAPGLKGYELLNWFGLFATGGTPADVIDKINAVTNKTLAEPKTAKTLSDQGIVARKTSPAEFKAFVEAESRKFREVIEKAKIKLEN
ncbi:Bug family tripartite tricarboxylate transporter substrate binding protein [Rhodoplanes sp. Z2-YC6860]|uniref:Bug family tripartite tricarboxylate transporter substrate binding protein n=1 Tax=Rhodoplanes sp. Z2-YC6860 TaxID=674703 RepID=UPI00078D2F31|nr:tripartite tricarboxylate transporter substrate-binding protein [Rhodoplanes sp. Z2-YC6860]AMN42752.1 extra-cytoplasmic solute receptor BugT [Rhodoplanes sp. Z2-YC6860]